MSQPLDLTDFDAVSFDCYGTLIDWEAAPRRPARLGRPPWADRGRRGPADRLYGHHERTVRGRAPDHALPRRAARLHAGLGERPGRRGVVVRTPTPWPPRSRTGRRSTTPRPRWPPSPQRYKLVILSNVDRDLVRGQQRPARPHVHRMVTAQDVGSYKPSARNFEALLTATTSWGCPGATAARGTEPVPRPRAGKAAGLPTVWINRRAGRDGWGATPRRRRRSPRTPPTRAWPPSPPP